MPTVNSACPISIFTEGRERGTGPGVKFLEKFFHTFNIYEKNALFAIENVRGVVAPVEKGGMLEYFPIKFEINVFTNSKVRKFYDKTLRFPKSDDFEKTGGMVVFS